MDSGLPGLPLLCVVLGEIETLEKNPSPHEAPQVAQGYRAQTGETDFKKETRLNHDY